MSRLITHYEKTDSTFRILRHYNHRGMLIDHFHDAYEIYYLRQGRRRYFIRNRHYEVIAGDLILINKFELHRTGLGASDDHERVLINFHESFLGEWGRRNPALWQHPFAGGLHLLRLESGERRQLEYLLERMEEEARTRDDLHERFLSLLLVELLLFIHRCSAGKPPAAGKQETPAQRTAAEIASFLQKRYKEPVKLQELSERFYMSASYISRVFKEVTGFSLAEYINHLRVTEAQRLLRESDDKIADVSGQAGFDNLSHFGRIFRKIAGCSPKQYRVISRKHMT